MPELPTSFGKYYLTEKLATGGMAEIYLAKIIGPGGFEKPLVIKQILPKLTGQRHFVDLFVAEAKTLVTLTHGNIVPVYEFGVIDETYFIAMDYIDGPTLYRLTETMSRREGRMEPALAAWITARMLEGLDYAHRKGEGVIHRDLSPRNVMMSRDGEVKLVDFGIAVTLGDPGEAAGTESAPTGSFPYMSPEQARRESLTGQTDLFSVGVLAWEMLTGRRLFARPDADATLAAVQRETIPHPSSVRPEIPAKLDDVVMRALERDRGSRWQTAADMLAPLNKYLYSLDETPGPRDVAALVARFCPPETRRLPTHLEAIAHDVISPEPLATDDAPSAPIASGPSTAVIPRDLAARGRPQRQKSFATNVDLKSILERADPLPSFADEKSDVNSDILPRFDAVEDSPTKDELPDKRTPFAADTVIDDAPAALSGISEERIERPIRRTPRSVSSQPRVATNPPTNPPPQSAPRAPTNPPPRAPTNPPLERPRTIRALHEPTEIDMQPLGSIDTPQLGSVEVSSVIRQPPSRFVLVLAGVGALALAIGAVVIFFQGRAAVLASGDAGVDARRDANPDASELVDGGLIDASLVDAPRELAPPTRDARHGEVVMHIDAGPAIDAAAKGNATLRVGADPWGEIYVDGKSMGRTPQELTVSAGHHTVEIVFPAETPPRKQTFAVDLANGETKPLQADFNR